MFVNTDSKDKNSGAKKATYLFRDGEFNLEDFCARENITDKKHLFSGEEPKIISIAEEQTKEIFVENAICYFPPNRYEKPNWMGKSYYDISESEHPSAKEKISGRLDKPISVENVNPRTLQWLLDVIADSRADIEQEGDSLKVVHTKVEHLLALGVARKNLETIMSEILGKKIFFGLNRRDTAGYRFNINSIENGTPVALSLDALSTGQSALFNMFATIIRYAEMIDLNNSIRLEDITGIVVIDEVELHLHTNLKKKFFRNYSNDFRKFNSLFHHTLHYSC